MEETVDDYGSEDLKLPILRHLQRKGPQNQKAKEESCSLEVARLQSRERLGLLRLCNRRRPRHD